MQKKLLCIDNSIQSSKTKDPVKYLLLPQLVVGNEYIATGENKKKNGWIIKGLDNRGTFESLKGYAKSRFIELPEIVGEGAAVLCNYVNTKNAA